MNKWQTANSQFYKISVERKRYLKANPTQSEALLWEELRNSKLGIKFRRQHIIGVFIVDFVCLSSKIVVEVDGEIHEFQKEYDANRTLYLEQEGFRVIRFKNKDVINSIPLVLQEIKGSLNQLS